MGKVLIVAALTAVGGVAFAENLEISHIPAEVSYAPAVKIPDEARAKHLKGLGIFLVHVYRDGRVRQVEMIRSTGHSILDQAAKEALAKWRFRPWVTKVLVPMRFDGNYPADKFR